MYRSRLKPYRSPCEQQLRSPKRPEPANPSKQEDFQLLPKRHRGLSPLNVAERSCKRLQFEPDDTIHEVEPYQLSLGFQSARFLIDATANVEDPNNYDFERMVKETNDAAKPLLQSSLASVSEQAATLVVEEMVYIDASIHAKELHVAIVEALERQLRTLDMTAVRLNPHQAPPIVKSSLTEDFRQALSMGIFQGLYAILPESVVWESHSLAMSGVERLQRSTLKAISHSRDQALARADLAAEAKKPS